MSSLNGRSITSLRVVNNVHIDGFGQLNIVGGIINSDSVKGSQKGDLRLERAEGGVLLNYKGVEGFIPDSNISGLRFGAKPSEAV